MSWDSAIRSKLQGKKIFVTGHNGFKGSWLVSWLACYDCEIVGYSLGLPAKSLYADAGLSSIVNREYIGDIRDFDHVKRSLIEVQPDLILHLAAQSLVRLSYREPLETWSTNVQGTATVLQAARLCPSVKAVLVVTSDKCYENMEWAWGYRESDRLGGYDPYSASKAATELVVSSFKKSFYDNGGPSIASARAGNVIGGGDWSEDRLVPDAVRAIQEDGELLIRSPHATRPWQHVLDCLQGYLLLATTLLDNPSSLAGTSAYNFGPDSTGNLEVADFLERMGRDIPELKWSAVDDLEDTSEPHEAGFLYLDSSLSRRTLGWSPRWNVDEAISATADWYMRFMDRSESANDLMKRQLKEYLSE